MLLHAAAQAWSRVTGHDDEEWAYETTVSYETGANSNGGWPEPDFETAPFLINLRQDDLKFFTPTGRFFNTHSHYLITFAAPRVRNEAEALLRQHGGLPPRLVYIELHLIPADYWDLAVVRRDWPTDWRRLAEPNWRDVAPYHRQLAVVTSKPDAARWSEADQERGLRGLVGLLLADDLALSAPTHAAIPTLRQWHAAATGLLPDWQDHEASD